MWERMSSKAVFVFWVVKNGDERLGCNDNVQNIIEFRLLGQSLEQILRRIIFGGEFVIKRR